MRCHFFLVSISQFKTRMIYFECFLFHIYCITDRIYVMIRNIRITSQNISFFKLPINLRIDSYIFVSISTSHSNHNRQRGGRKRRRNIGRRRECGRIRRVRVRSGGKRSGSVGCVRRGNQRCRHGDAVVVAYKRLRTGGGDDGCRIGCNRCCDGRCNHQRLGFRCGCGSNECNDSQNNEDHLRMANVS